jgi:hypothetical protein
MPDPAPQGKGCPTWRALCSSCVSCGLSTFSAQGIQCSPCGQTIAESLYLSHPCRARDTGLTSGFHLPQRPYCLPWEAAQFEPPEVHLLGCPWVCANNLGAYHLPQLHHQLQHLSLALPEVGHHGCCMAAVSPVSRDVVRKATEPPCLGTVLLGALWGGAITSSGAMGPLARDHGHTTLVPPPWKWHTCG